MLSAAVRRLRGRAGAVPTALRAAPGWRCLSSAPNPFLGIDVPVGAPPTGAGDAPADAGEGDGAGGGAGGERPRRPKGTIRFRSSNAIDRAERLERDRVRLQGKYHPGKTEHAAAANFKQLPVAPKKLRVVANLALGQYVREAMLQLEHGRKNIGIMVKNAIAHATRRAQEKGLDPTRLVVDSACVAKGQYVKRLDYKSRGRVGTKKQYASNLHLTVKQVSVEEIEATPGYGRWAAASRMLKVPWAERVAALPRYVPVDGYEPGEHRYRLPVAHRDGKADEPNVPTFR